LAAIVHQRRERALINSVVDAGIGNFDGPARFDKLALHPAGADNSNY
jgi:hypothetical protein